MGTDPDPDTLALLVPPPLVLPVDPVLEKVVVDNDDGGVDD